jgi:PleD family two-component response regulator
VLGLGIRVSVLLGVLPRELARAARSGQPLCVALLLPDRGLGSAMEIAERLRTAQPEGTCPIGVADWDGREATARLVARADQALYAAKEGDRNRSHAAPTADTASTARARPADPGPGPGGPTIPGQAPP